VEKFPHLHLRVGRPEAGLGSFSSLPPALEKQLRQRRLGSFQSLFNVRINIL
jgi:hypothetical protein